MPEKKKHPFIRKLAELDEKYHWTLYAEAFLLGFAICLLLLYTHPEYFPRIRLIENMQAFDPSDYAPENLENIVFDNLKP